ncbi:hypothetical protein EYR41_005878 [Orbilia oligospora]|uniref:Uncharacterized protein n=1 Tax=Orbilia oligospora TaxID=2813651 RepID=A0A7C8PXU0_ORBOL|nr:hypothetical protein TWF751_004289 [Orbilia oligospora]TGJ69870.1 hypothetical protein EYR41_005878 [Orbilia oligospora]
MAPKGLVQLARSPEILYLILDCLPNADLFSLLQTCKSLYPTCYRHLWSVLVFDSTDWYWYPRKGIEYDAVGKLMQTQDNIGYQYTKVLDFGSALFYNTLHVEFRKQLGRLLDIGQLAPKTVMADISVLNDEERDCYPDALRLLRSLKKYSRTKSPGEFSVQLRTGFIRLLPEHFDLPKITRYDLVSAYKLGPNEKVWSVDGPSPKEHIKELTNILAQLVNLQWFSWDSHTGKYYIDRRTRFKLSEGRQGLEKLQTTFTNMRHLKTLICKNHFFGPSFFVIPPPTVKVLELGGSYHSASCSFTGVELLEICKLESQHEIEDPIGDRNEFKSINELVLGGVAVTGLKGFNAKQHDCWSRRKNGYCPIDLNECILQRNKKIGPNTFKAIATSRAAELIYQCERSFVRKIKACSPLLREIIIEGPKIGTLETWEVGIKHAWKFAIDCQDTIQYRLAWYMEMIQKDQESTNGDELDHEMVSMECLRMLVRNPEFGNSGTLGTGREPSDIIQHCGHMWEAVHRCVGMARHEYTRRFANYEPPNEQKFMRTCLKMLSRWPNLKDARKWEAKTRAGGLVFGHTNTLIQDVQLSRSTLINESTEKFFKGGKVEMESVTNQWVRRLAEAK